MKARTFLSSLLFAAASMAASADSLQFSVASVAVTEGTATVMLGVTRVSPAIGVSAGVTWTTVDGTAHAGTDFGPVGDATPLTGTLNGASGAGKSQMITIPITNDTLIQGARTFTVQLSDPSGAGVTIGTIPTVTVRINDNDKGFAFASPTYTVGEAADNVVLSVQRIGPTTTTASATWSTANGTATAGQDFGTLNNATQRSGTFSWAIGDANPKNIVIPIINDALGGEGDETFTVSLTPGTGYILGSPGSATVTIQDNDIPPESELRFTQPKYSVLEDAGSVTLGVERVVVAGGNLDRPASANFTTVAGSAMATYDYVAKTGVLSWAAGEGGTKTITINIVNNAVAEPPELFTVRLSNAPSGVGISAPGEAAVLILDDDEKFPPEGAIPSGFGTPSDTTSGFHVSNDPGAYEGAFSLKNDFIDDGESAGIEMTGTFAAGNVSFRVKVSTEASFDVLSFYIDGVLKNSWSGNTIATWQASPMYSFTTPGPHTLKWVYSKDASVSLGADAVYIDGLVTPAFTPAP